MRRLGMPLAAAWAVCLVAAGCTTTVDGTPSAGGTAGTGTTAERPAGDLRSLLLSLDEVEDILKFRTMVNDESWTAPNDKGSYQPPGCVGAVFSGMALAYEHSGYREYFGLRYTDASPGGWWHWVDEAVASFDSPAAAQRYLADSVDRWRGCAGQRLTFAYPDLDDWQEPRIVGEAAQAGCVATVANAVEGHPEYYELRALAAKSTIVVDLQFSGFDVNDEAATVMGRILERIPPTGVNCAFQG